MPLDPLTVSLALQGVNILGNMGANYLDRGQQRKAQREMDRRVSMANLSRAFGGNPTISPVEVKSTGGAQFLRNLGQAAGLGSQAIGLYQGMKGAADAAARKNQLQDLQIQAATNQLEQTAGAQAQLAGGTVPVQVDEALRGTSQTYNAPIQGNQLLSPAFRAGARQQENDSLMQLLKLAGTGPGARSGARSGGSPQPSMEDTLKSFGPVVRNAAESGRTWDELISGGAFSQINPDYVPYLQMEYQNTARKSLASKNAELSNFLYGDLKSKWGSSELLSKSGDLIFGMNLMANGYNQANGVGDLMMVNAMVRLSDPGVSVRPIESLQMEEVGGVLEKFNVIVSGEKYLEGNKFNDNVRNKLLSAAKDLYGGQSQLINGVLEQEINAALPRFQQLGGTQDALKLFASTYYLPAIEKYQIKTREKPDNSSESNVISGENLEFLRGLYE